MAKKPNETPDELLLEDVFAQLGPLRFGGDWIPKLTDHEEWLLSDQMLITHPEREGAEWRESKMTFQHDRLLDWLQDNDVRVSHFSRHSTVKAAEYEAAFARVFGRPRSDKATIEDEVALAEMLAARREQGESFAVYAWVLANDARIKGPNVDAKVRRLQRKFKDM